MITLCPFYIQTEQMFRICGCEEVQHRIFLRFEDGQDNIKHYNSCCRSEDEWKKCEIYDIMRQLQTRKDLQEQIKPGMTIDELAKIDGIYKRTRAAARE